MKTNFPRATQKYVRPQLRRQSTPINILTSNPQAQQVPQTPPHSHRAIFVDFTTFVAFAAFVDFGGPDFLSDLL
jgi:hypothetical protein